MSKDVKANIVVDVGQCQLLTQSGPHLIHEIKDTFLGIQPKVSNIKNALIVFISPAFHI